MRIEDVMTRRVQSVSPETPAETAWELMRTKGIHHLVVTKNRAVVGVVSDRDVGGRQGASVRRNRSVADLMTSPALTVSPETTVRKAANLMRGRSIGCLVVAEGARVSGIVTVSDLLELVGRGVDRPVAATTRWALRHRVPHRKVHQPSAW